MSRQGLLLAIKCSAELGRTCTFSEYQILVYRISLCIVPTPWIQPFVRSTVASRHIIQIQKSMASLTVA